MFGHQNSGSGSGSGFSLKYWIRIRIRIKYNVNPKLCSILYIICDYDWMRASRWALHAITRLMQSFPLLEGRIEL
jgi:hypothetical protein